MSIRVFLSDGLTTVVGENVYVVFSQRDLASEISDMMRGGDTTQYNVTMGKLESFTDKKLDISFNLVDGKTARQVMDAEAVFGSLKNALLEVRRRYTAKLKEQQARIKEIVDYLNVIDQEIAKQ